MPPDARKAWQGGAPPHLTRAIVTAAAAVVAAHLPAAVVMFEVCLTTNVPEIRTRIPWPGAAGWKKEPPHDESWRRHTLPE